MSPSETPSEHVKVVDLPSRATPPSRSKIPKARIRIVPVLITVATTAIAMVLGWAMWNAYMVAPWTRNGTVSSYVVTKAPEVAGRIVELPVRDNQRVHKGDLIVRLSAPELVAQRAQAESALHAAESQLTSAQAKLAADKGTYLHLASAAKTPGVVAENDVMVADQTASADQGQVQSAESNVAAAREALRSVTQLESYLNINAPFDGVVTTRNLHPGALVGPASQADWRR